MVSGVTVGAQASTRFNVVGYNPATHRTVAPDEVDLTGPDPPINDTTPADSTTGDEDSGSGSNKISVSAKSSRLASVIGPTPATVPVTVTITPQVINITTTVLPARTTPPATRPTAQPGFGAVIALISLGMVAFHVVREHRK